jgi:hypothetical protein
MRVPHGRLQITDVRHRPTHNGLAFTATQTVDGTPVGSISNDGSGGPTELSSPNSLFGWSGM